MLQNFIESLKESPSFHSLFNPWYEVDTANDGHPESPQIRRQHLQLYLEQRLESAGLLLIAEAVGYQGGHFSGIAMTSERMLLGHHKSIFPADIVKNHTFQQTSRAEIWPQGLTEPTATMVWESLLGLGLSADGFVLWNAFPWHPYQPQHSKGMLNNRTPTAKEMEYSKPFLHSFLQLFPHCKLLAIGQKCSSLLASMGVDCAGVRHPANGGATQFRSQTRAFLQNHLP